MKISYRDFSIFLFVTLVLAQFSAASEPIAITKPTIDVGIVARDVEVTARFLTSALGFIELKGFSVTSEFGKKLGIFDDFGPSIAVRVFSLGEKEQAVKVKVLPLPNAGQKKSNSPFVDSSSGFRFLTFYVNDMALTLKRLKAAKVKTLGATPFDMGGGRYIVVVRDPDDNVFELIGPMKPSLPKTNEAGKSR